MSTRPTLATVADAVGVSRMTVSNAFNRPDQLSPELRERVLATARELGYGGPDPGARALSKGKTGSVGVIIDAPLTLAFTDPAAVQMLQGVASVCEQEELGITLVPRIKDRDAQLVKTALVDGFVVYCMADDDPRMDAIVERRLPFAMIDYEPSKADLTVNITDREGARRTAQHLIDLGHRRFGVVLGWDNPFATADEVLSAMQYHVDRERLRGWRDAIEAAGVPFDTVQHASGPGFNQETGRIAGGKLLDRANRPTAIVCESDQMALGVLQAARERGVAVPQQLSVVGFDDTPEAARAGLTTVRQPHQEKGAAALRLLLDTTTPQASVLLPTELVPRSSTAPSP